MHGCIKDDPSLSPTFLCVYLCVLLTNCCTVCMYISFTFSKTIDTVVYLCLALSYVCMHMYALLVCTEQ